MLGFADIADDAVLTTAEIAERLGFAHSQSLQRALRRQGARLPPCLLRGRYRGQSVKAWFAGLDPFSPVEPAEDQDRPASAPPRAPGGNVIPLRQQRNNLRERIGMV